MIGLVALAAACAWALRAEQVAPRLPAVSTPERSLVDDRGGTRAPGLDLAAFDAPIWNPAVAPAPETPAASPPDDEGPIDLQLVAITTDDEGRWAALYDPAGDRLAFLAVGDVCAGFQVAAITGDAVELTRAGAVHRLRLRPDEVAP